MAAASIASYTLLKRGESSTNLAAKDVGKIEIAAESNKLLSVGGFLVANSIIVCRESAWESGGGAKTCRYDAGQRTDANFSMEKFGFSNQRRGDSNQLILDFNAKSIIEPTDKIRITSATIGFSLVDANSDSRLKELLGDKSSVLKSIDADNYVVLVKAELKYKKEGKDYTNTAIQAFKRPIAMTRLTLSTGTACAGRCNSSLSQNPFPSCRGPQSVSDQAVVEIVGTTTNLGPGVLYGLTYERAICLKNDLSTVIGANGENCVNQGLSGVQASLSVPIQDYLRPDKPIRWTDTAPCREFVQTTRGWSAGQAVQHVTEAGRVTYQIDASSGKSKIEPFRLNDPIDQDTGKLPGRLNVIYVVPTH